MKKTCAALLALALGGGALPAAASPRPGKGPTGLTCAPAPAPAKETTICSGSGTVLVNEKARFSFETGPHVGSVSVRLTPSSTSGDADLEVLPPPGGGEAKSSRQASGPDVVSFTAPPAGAWSVDVLGFGDETDFEVEAVLAPASPPLHADDAAVLKAVVEGCCKDAGSCKLLKGAVAAAGAKPGSDAAGGDLCSRPPNACDGEGRVTTLSLAGEGLACRFPPDLGRLARLVSLDLTANALHGDWGRDVGPVLKALAPRLEAARLSLNQLGGELTCDLIGGDGAAAAAAGNLRVLALTGNRAAGPLPPCLFAGPVRELYAARNELGGALPAIPMDSPLTRVALSDQEGRGFEGGVPDLANAAGLVSFRAAGGRLEGRLPADLPPALTDLSLARNRLDGPIPPAWGGGGPLEVLDAEDNRLEGELPAALVSSPALIRLSLGRNRLEGDLPEQWAATLEHVALPANAFTGPLPAGLASPPGLALLDLSDNRLSGPGLDAFADRLEAAQGQRQSLARYLNLGGNRLTGRVPPGLASAGALGPGAWATTSPDAAAAGRPGGLIGKTLNLTGNAFTGAVPSFLVAALATQKDVEVGLAGNDWDCPDEVGQGGGAGSTAAGEWARVVDAALPASTLAGVECVPAGVPDANRDDKRVPLGSLLQAAASAGDRDARDAKGERPTRAGEESAEEAGEVDKPPAPVTPSTNRDRASGGRIVRPAADEEEEGAGGAGDVDRADGGRAGEAAGAAAGGRIVRPSSDDDDDDDGGRKKEKHADDSHHHDHDDDDDDDDDKGHKKAGAAKAHGDDGGDEEDDDHHHGRHSFLATAFFSIAAALAAATATLYATRTALPAAIAAWTRRHWRSVSATPFAGLGAFDAEEAEPLDGSGLAMSMELGATTTTRPAPKGPPSFDLKAQAGGVPVGPVIDATGGGGGGGGGGIGAYRPPAAPRDEEEGASGSGDGGGGGAPLI